VTAATSPDDSREGSPSARSVAGPEPIARPLALRPKDAAGMLGIGARLLWSMTNRGEVPHVRLGRAVLYPVAELERWLAEQTRPKGGRR
jgi:excisionase family DNA binding protein